VDWIPTKFKFNEASALKAAASMQPHSERHKIICSKLQSNDSSCKNPILAVEDDAEAIDHSLMETDDLHAEHLVACETGLHVRAICTFLGASPDGIVSCSYHAERLLEIKCPFKYKNSISGWEQDKDFPIDENIEMKPNHRYYYQVQLQMFVCSKTMM